MLRLVPPGLDVCEAVVPGQWASCRPFMRLRLVSVVAILAIAVSGVAGCKIKYDGDKSAPNGAFDAKTYVAEIVGLEGRCR